MGTNQELALDFVASCQLIKRDVSLGRSGGSQRRDSVGDYSHQPLCKQRSLAVTKPVRTAEDQRLQMFNSD